jgi:hypothetical protein
MALLGHRPTRGPVNRTGRGSRADRRAPAVRDTGQGREEAAAVARRRLNGRRSRGHLHAPHAIPHQNTPQHVLLLFLIMPAARAAAAALLAAAHRRRWCPNGPSELGLSIQRARRSFLARRRRMRGALASLATAARNSGEAELTAVAAGTPEACSPRRDWLRGGVQWVAEVVAEVLAEPIGQWHGGAHTQARRSSRWRIPRVPEKKRRGGKGWRK